jgi:hypothetical protein
MIDFGDLAVLDAAADVAAGRPRPVHHADAHIVFAMDAGDAKLLIADRRAGRLFHRRLDFGIADVERAAARRLRRHGAHQSGAAGAEQNQCPQSTGLHANLLYFASTNSMASRLGPSIIAARVSPSR